MSHDTPNAPLRRTKIIATLGPASDAPGAIEALIAAGVNIVRLNFSHGAKEHHAARIQAVRDAAHKDRKSTRLNSIHNQTPMASSAWKKKKRTTLSRS